MVWQGHQTRLENERPPRTALSPPFEDDSSAHVSELYLQATNPETEQKENKMGVSLYNIQLNNSDVNNVIKPIHSERKNPCQTFWDTTTILYFIVIYGTYMITPSYMTVNC